MAYLDRTNITGEDNNVRHGQGPKPFGVMNDMVGEQEFPLFTVKRGPGRHDPGLQGCCQKKGLNGRTRLIGICNGTVSPLIGLVFPEDIGIKGGDHSHGENFPCLRIQYDAVSTLCSGFCNSPL